MNTEPSIPHPESAERRAAMTRQIMAATGLDEDVLETLVGRFYERARQDDVIGPLFDRVTDWEGHTAKISQFWSSVALATGRYQGQPMAAHMPLQLEPAHFRRWLSLFEATAREVCPPGGASLLIEKAQRIAGSLEVGLAVSRGELPLRRPLVA